ncbi:protein translocase subunit SecD [Chloroflexota bacterium]
MPRKNTRILLIVIAIAVLAALVVLPINRGILGGRGVRLGLDLQGGVHIVYQADLSTIESGRKADAMEATVAILENRINPLGVTEPVIQIQGDDRIVVELPGIDITDKEKDSLSSVVLLEFGELVTGNETARWENSIGKWNPATAVINGEEKALTSSYFSQNTEVRRGQLGGVVLGFQWDEEGSELSEIITGRMAVNKDRLGIFEGDTALLGDEGRPIAPRVNSMIVDEGIIEGLSLSDATRLSSQLNAGRLPVPLEIIYDQTVSSILGSDFIYKSINAGLIGIILVMLFMVFYYRLSGLLACLALLFYGILIMALFKFNILGIFLGDFTVGPVTLTLAGLGGFILSVGMAVDANVLIFERMKEELRAGRTLGAAIDAGFNRAWTAIRDGNITTIIVCVILYWVGSVVAAGAPVKGFALTLGIGVVVSMFTAIVVTRTLLRLCVGTPLRQKTWLFAPHLRKKDD